MISSLNLGRIDIRDVKAPAVAAPGALTADIVALLVLLLRFRPVLGGDGQVVVAELDIDILLLESGQLCLQNVGPAFILLSALVLGAKYGALSGAIGLALADLLAGYTTSAPPTFLAMFLLGWSTAWAAQHLCHLDRQTDDSARLRAAALAAVFGSVVNVVTEPLIRFSFKFFILGMPRQIAYISALNCAVSMAVSNVVSVMLTVILYMVAEKSIRI